MDELTRELQAARWYRSTWSGPDGGNCVEVAELSGGRRGVRDSKEPGRRALVMPPAEWTAFVRSLKDGRMRSGFRGTATGR
ncbi:hypothetical protein Sru01_69350 [Sphaerisporangium rufum]|uniref:DUF397 domain-containing protein n=1 Tax=Sphaerisporangium rufum TaxID=1381558 RepID=A0A919RA13_9ACTN|nr:DUF397 domain-containing protein [Sphaerisporangium rufum]GII81953.1 hypothetical protein Sru01_69350 [Sphaerisporangium rufum]